jgi:hypothetical protein
MRRVLVSGSAGFIGGYLVAELLNRDYEVGGVDDYSTYGKVRRSYDDALQLRGAGEYEPVRDVAGAPGNRALALSHVVPDLVRRSLTGQDPLRILGSGDQVRHYTSLRAAGEAPLSGAGPAGAGPAALAGCLGGRLLAPRLAAARMAPALLVVGTGYLLCLGREIAAPPRPGAGRTYAMRAPSASPPASATRAGTPCWSGTATCSVN